jgi:hypothetical protein
MTKLLQKAFEEAEQLLSPEEQDALAYVLLGFVEDERKWDAAFSNPKSQSLLERLVAEALEEERAEKTDKLDPDAL